MAKNTETYNTHEYCVNCISDSCTILCDQVMIVATLNNMAHAATFSDATKTQYTVQYIACDTVKALLQCVTVLMCGSVSCQRYEIPLYLLY